MVVRVTAGCVGGGVVKAFDVAFGIVVAVVAVFAACFVAAEDGVVSQSYSEVSWGYFGSS